MHDAQLKSVLLYHVFVRASVRPQAINVTFQLPPDTVLTLPQYILGVEIVHDKTHTDQTILASFVYFHEHFMNSRILKQRILGSFSCGRLLLVAYSLTSNITVVGFAQHKQKMAEVISW
jgi:hypothetical protein